MILLALNEQILKCNNINTWPQYMNLAHFLILLFNTTWRLLVNL